MSRFQRHLLSGIIALVAASIGMAPMHQARSEGLDGMVDNEGVVVRRVTITLNKSRTFELRRPFTTAVIGGTSALVGGKTESESVIADVLPLSNRVIYIQGKRVGTTNVSLFDENKRLIGVFDVEVTIDARNIAQKIQAATNSPGIQVSSSNEQVILSGEAKDAIDADRAVAVATAMVPKDSVVNLMRVAPSQQVLLKVRFIEANRKTGRDLGVNWFVSNESGTRGINTGLGSVATTRSSGLSVFETLNTFAGAATGQPFGVALASLASGGINIDVLITALETRGLARRLAEPDLVALSGDTASFLAGGEFPYPTVQDAGTGVPTITTEFKPFGVQLTFVPTVLANGIINLRLSPSVSQLDYTNAVRISGFLVPSLTKREARTTIELRDGQSFAIAGLLQTSGQRDISQIPWLGTMPILGPLFRSTAYQQQETDLVVIVTPHLVQPVAPGQRLATPLDKTVPSNDKDLFLRGDLELPRQYSEYVTSGKEIVGPYGHMIFLDPK